MQFTVIIRGVACVNITHDSARIYQDDPVATTTPRRTVPVHPGEPTVQHGSTRFWTSSRFTPVVFDMSKTAGAAHGSSRNIPDHPGPPSIATVRPPVEPGAMWDCSLNDLKWRIYEVVRVIVLQARYNTHTRCSRKI